MVSSTNKSPKSVLMTLLQEKWMTLIEENLDGSTELRETLDDNITWFTRERLANDPLPSVHVVFDEIDTDQRGMPHHKKSYDDITLNVAFYSENYSNDWITHQSIKQIIVENNQVQSVDDGDNVFDNSGWEFTRVTKARFNVIYDNTGENAVFYFVMDVVVKLQEDYN